MSVFDPKSVSGRVEGYHDQLDEFKSRFSKINTGNVADPNQGFGFAVASGGDPDPGTDPGGGTEPGGLAGRIQFIRGTSIYLATRKFLDGEPGLNLDDLKRPQLYVQTAEGFVPLTVRTQDVTGLAALLAANVTHTQLTEILKSYVTLEAFNLALLQRVTKGELETALAGKLNAPAEPKARKLLTLIENPDTKKLKEVWVEPLELSLPETPTTIPADGYYLNVKEIAKDPVNAPNVKEKVFGWGTLPSTYMRNYITSTGDLIIGSGGSGYDRLPIGPLDHVLTVKKNTGKESTAKWEPLPNFILTPTAYPAGRAFLLRNGATALWANVNEYPSTLNKKGQFLQVVDENKVDWVPLATIPSVSATSKPFLTHDGKSPQWGDIPDALPTLKSEDFPGLTAAEKEEPFVALSAYLMDAGKKRALRWTTYDSLLPLVGRKKGYLLAINEDATTNVQTIGWVPAPSGLPKGTEQDGLKYLRLREDGGEVFWDTVAPESVFPSMQDNKGKYLTIIREPLKDAAGNVILKPDGTPEEGPEKLHWDFPFLNPMTEQGSMIYGGPKGSPKEVKPGADKSVLQMLDGLPSWRVGVVLPDRDNYQANYFLKANDPSMEPSWEEIPRELPEVFVPGKYLSNNGAMTIWTDAPSVLPPQDVTTHTKVLSSEYDATSQKSAVKWIHSPSGFANPMADVGDMVTGGPGGIAERVARGADNALLIVDETTKRPVFRSLYAILNRHGGAHTANFLSTNLNGDVVWKYVSQVPDIGNNPPGSYLGWKDGKPAWGLPIPPISMQQAGNILTNNGVFTEWSSYASLLPPIKDDKTGLNHIGKYLRAKGEAAVEWDVITADSYLPRQPGNAGKFLVTNGEDASWAALAPMSAYGEQTTSVVNKAFHVASTGTVELPAIGGQSVWLSWAATSVAGTEVVRLVYQPKRIKNTLTLRAHVHGKVVSSAVESTKVGAALSIGGIVQRQEFDQAAPSEYFTCEPTGTLEVTSLDDIEILVLAASEKEACTLDGGACWLEVEETDSDFVPPAQTIRSLVNTSYVTGSVYDWIKGNSPFTQLADLDTEKYTLLTLTHTPRRAGNVLRVRASIHRHTPGTESSTLIAGIGIGNTLYKNWETAHTGSRTTLQVTDEGFPEYVVKTNETLTINLFIRADKPTTITSSTLEVEEWDPVYVVNSNINGGPVAADITQVIPNQVVNRYLIPTRLAANTALSPAKPTDEEITAISTQSKLSNKERKLGTLTVYPTKVGNKLHIHCESHHSGWGNYGTGNDLLFLFVDGRFFTGQWEYYHGHRAITLDAHYQITSTDVINIDVYALSDIFSHTFQRGGDFDKTPSVGWVEEIDPNFTISTKNSTAIPNVLVQTQRVQSTVSKSLTARNVKPSDLATTGSVPLFLTYNPKRPGNFLRIKYGLPLNLHTPVLTALAGLEIDGKLVGKVSYGSITDGTVMITGEVDYPVTSMGDLTLNLRVGALEEDSDGVCEATDQGWMVVEEYDPFYTFPHSAPSGVAWGTTSLPNVMVQRVLQRGMIGEGDIPEGPDTAEVVTVTVTPKKAGNVFKVSGHLAAYTTMACQVTAHMQVGGKPFGRSVEATPNPQMHVEILGGEYVAPDINPVTFKLFASSNQNVTVYHKSQDSHILVEEFDPCYTLVTGSDGAQAVFGGTIQAMTDVLSAPLALSTSSVPPTYFDGTQIHTKLIIPKTKSAKFRVRVSGSVHSLTVDTITSHFSLFQDEVKIGEAHTVIPEGKPEVFTLLATVVTDTLNPTIFSVRGGSDEVGAEAIEVMTSILEVDEIAEVMLTPRSMCGQIPVITKAPGPLPLSSSFYSECGGDVLVFMSGWTAPNPAAVLTLTLNESKVIGTLEQPSNAQGPWPFNAVFKVNLTAGKHSLKVESSSPTTQDNTLLNVSILEFNAQTITQAIASMGGLPPQTDMEGRFLYTNGMQARWEKPPTGIPTMSATTKGQVLSNTGDAALWVEMPKGFVNPMTSSQDLILGGNVDDHGVAEAVRLSASKTIRDTLQILPSGLVGWGSVPWHGHSWEDINTEIPFATYYKAGLVKIGKSLSVGPDGRLNTLKPLAPTAGPQYAVLNTPTAPRVDWKGRSFQVLISASHMLEEFASFKLVLEILAGPVTFSALKLLRCNPGTQEVLSIQDVAFEEVVASVDTPLSLPAGVHSTDTLALPLSPTDSDYYLMGACQDIEENATVSAPSYQGTALDGYWSDEVIPPNPKTSGLQENTKYFLKGVIGYQPLPVANNTTLGLVKVGPGLAMSDDGVLSVASAISSNAGRNAFTMTIGDGTSRSIPVTHDLGSTDVAVSVWESAGERKNVHVDTRIVNENKVLLNFSESLPPPAVGSLRVTILKGGTSSGTSVGNFTHRIMATAMSQTSGVQVVRTVLYSLNVQNAGGDIRVFACTNEGVIIGEPLPIAVSGGGGYYNLAWQAEFAAKVARRFMILLGDPYLGYMRLPQDTLQNLLGAVTTPTPGSVTLKGAALAFVPPETVEEWGTKGDLFGGENVDYNSHPMTCPSWAFDGSSGVIMWISGQGSIGITTESRVSGHTNGEAPPIKGPDGFGCYVVNPSTNYSDLDRKFIRRVLLPDGWYLKMEYYWRSGGNKKLRVVLRYCNDGSMSLTWLDTENFTDSEFNLECLVNNQRTHVKSTIPPNRLQPSTYLCIKVLPTRPFASLGPEVAL